MKIQITLLIVLLTFTTFIHLNHADDVLGDYDERDENSIDIRGNLKRFFFWSYGWAKEKPKMGKNIKLKTGTRSTLVLTAADFKDSFGYGFVMGRMLMRLAFTCVEFDVPCNEGEIILSSNGHHQTFCGTRVPFNEASLSRFLHFSFKGKGGPYTAILKCFVIGLQGHLVNANKNIFTTLNDVVDCPEALPDPSTYATVDNCDCGSENSANLRSGADEFQIRLDDGIYAAPRIWNGSEADEHSHPFAVVIHGSSAEDFHCAAVLLSDQWLITAASCLRHLPVEYLVANIGSHANSDPSTGVSYKIREAVDLGYNVFTRETDLMMLELETPVDLTANWEIKPICLPNLCTTYEGMDGVVTGWGATDIDDTTTSDVLHYKDITIMTNVECDTYYTGYIKDDMICATNVCFKDQGGPLFVYNSKGHAELVGILSWSDGCGSANPGIFSRISYYAEEIIQVIQMTTASTVCKA